MMVRTSGKYSHFAVAMWAAISLALAAFPAAANDDVAPLKVGHWLALGPIAAPLPALAGDDPDHQVGAGELLDLPPLDPRGLWPHAGQGVNAFGGAT